MKQYALRTRSTHDVHHAIVGVNVVIGVLVVHCELHVVVRIYVPLVAVCDEAVVCRTLGLIALVVIVVFVVAILHKIVLYGRKLFTPRSSISVGVLPSTHQSVLSFDSVLLLKNLRSPPRYSRGYRRGEAFFSPQPPVPPRMTGPMPHF